MRTQSKSLSVWRVGRGYCRASDDPSQFNAVAETYDLAERQPELATATSHLTGAMVNRFLNIAMNRDDVVLQNEMQRRLGNDQGASRNRKTSDRVMRSGITRRPSPAATPECNYLKRRAGEDRSGIGSVEGRSGQVDAKRLRVVRGLSCQNRER